MNKLKHNLIALLKGMGLVVGAIVLLIGLACAMCFLMPLGFAYPVAAIDISSLLLIIIFGFLIAACLGWFK